MPRSPFLPKTLFASHANAANFNMSQQASKVLENMPEDGELWLRRALMARYWRCEGRPLVSLHVNAAGTNLRLEPFSAALRKRYAAYEEALNFIETHEGGLDEFTQGHKKMGLQVDDKGGVTYREWAPGAVKARLIGDFSE